MGKTKENDGSGKRKSKKTPEPEAMAETDSPQEEEYVVENILDKRTVNGVAEYFIKWKDWPSTTNTWEPLSNLSGCEELLKEFEKKIGGGEAGTKREGSVKKDKIPSKKPKKSVPEPVEDSEYEEEESTPEENFEVDVLEEVPAGKIPTQIVGVVPIDSLLTYLVQWDSGAGAAPKAKKQKSEDFGLVKANGFRLLYPELVIRFYQEHIAWKRDIQSPLEINRNVFDEKNRLRPVDDFKKEGKSKEALELSSSESDGSDNEMMVDDL